MSASYRCGCGWHYEGNDFTVIDAHRPEPGNCCNCGGRKCMDCVLRYMHDQCEDSCPDCR